jgi:hypothetical protein
MNKFIEPLIKKYRVEVVEIATGKVVKVIGRNMSERMAERRELTGLSRFNIDLVFVRTVEE